MKGALPGFKTGRAPIALRSPGPRPAGPMNRPVEGQGMGLPGRWVRFADRHRTSLLAACAVAALLGGVGTVRLYSDLRPDLSELLPARSRSTVDAAAIAARMGGLAEESVVLAGSDPVALEILADDLVEKLEAEPPGLIRSIEARFDPVREFYLPRLLLFPTVPELVRLRDTLEARIAWERARRPSGGGIHHRQAGPGRGGAPR